MKLTIANARSEDWFNSGIISNGWTAPYLSWDSLIKINRSTFYANVGSACAQFDYAFQQSGDSHGIDPVYLALISMQESSCDPEAGAGTGTVGLMQVACANFPDGVCTTDVAKNVDAGAGVLANALNNTGRNAIKTIGSYNGWFTAADGTGLNSGQGLTQGYPCSAQGIQQGAPQNLDYLQETLNGFFVGQNPQGDQSWIGTYRCQGNCNNGQLC
jgi:Transglycosylase SLT domain